MRRFEVAAAYDERADEYRERFGSVDQMSPRDRATISAWGRSVAGPVLDVGCGPGHWGDLIAAESGNDVIGLDASCRFLSAARRGFPSLRLVAGDLEQLPFGDDSVGGVLAWFSLIHADPEAVASILGEFTRVLRPAGSLLIGYFEGPAREPFDHAVTTAYYWSADALGELVRSCGLTVQRASARQDPGIRRQGDLTAIFRS